jgi:WD40 repeat protein
VLATETPASIVIWDLTSRAVRSTIPLQKDDAVLSIASSPSGDLIAMATRDAGVRLWDVEKNLYRATPFVGHSGFVDGLTFSPDGKTLASGSADESVMLWDVDTGLRRRWWPKQPAWVFLLEFSPDSRYIAWGMRTGQVRVFDQKEERLLETGALGLRQVEALAFSPESRTLAIAGGDQIVVLDLLTESRVTTVHPAHRQRITGVAFSPRADVAASVSGDGELILWDTMRHAILDRSNAPSPLSGCVSFSPDGKRLITCSGAGTAFLWQVANRSTKLLGTISSESGKITVAAFRPDGQGFLTGDDGGGVSWWEAASPPGSTPRRLASLSCRIANFGFSSRGDLIAVGCVEGRILVIDPSGQQVARFENDSNRISGIEFSPDGQRLFSGSSGGIATWNLQSGAKVGTPLELRQSGADSVALSRTGVIASASLSGRMGLWDTETKTLLGEFRSHGDSFYSVAFAPSGKLLAAGSGYGAGGGDALMFMDLDPEHWVRYACAIAARNFTADEWQRYMSEESPRDTCAAGHAPE